MSVFQFKQFTINQSCTAMKVGTDSILFGSWIVVHKESQRILDVGTGTGVLALMLAQKSSNSKITALEIDDEAYKQALENIKNSPWANRVELIHTDAKKWHANREFDLIISNPPYFSDSLLSEKDSKNKARHQSAFKLIDLVDLWERQGSSNSSLACILPTDQSKKLIDLIQAKGYYLAKHTEVKTKLKLGAKRVLLWFSKKPTTTEYFNLCIHKDSGEYTEEYIDLTRDYYLKL